MGAIRHLTILISTAAAVTAATWAAPLCGWLSLVFAALMITVTLSLLAMPCDVSNLYRDVENAPADAQPTVMSMAARTSMLQEVSGSSWSSAGVGTSRGSHDSPAMLPLSQDGTPHQAVRFSSFDVDFTS